MATTVAPQALLPARLELHWAAQVLAAAADAWLVRRPDDSHTAMRWDPARGALVSETKLALRADPFELIAPSGESLALVGHTLADAMAWADRQLAAAEPGGAPRGIAARSYDMPAHPVGTAGARFGADRVLLAELARWYTRGQAALASHAGTAALRVWPHHFDLGAVLPLADGAELGIGLSPGDASYAEPYFYVTPYPLPPSPQLPALASGGHWHTTGFTGAILTATAIGERDPEAFLVGAIAAARALIAMAKAGPVTPKSQPER